MAAIALVVILLVVVMYACVIAASNADDHTMGDLQYVPDEELKQALQQQQKK